MLTIGDFSIEWGVLFAILGAGISLRILFKILKMYIYYKMGVSLIGYTNAYGGGDLRRDREPRFFAPKKRR